MDIIVAEELASIAIDLKIVDKDHRIFHEIDVALSRSVSENFVKVSESKIDFIKKFYNVNTMNRSIEEILATGYSTTVDRDFNYAQRKFARSIITSELKNGQEPSESSWVVASGYRKG